MSTIDPGLEQPVTNTAEDVEAGRDPKGPVKQQEDVANEEQDDSLRVPTEWWFASTACPLLAATFGPIANGFSICALVYSWRAYIPPGEAHAFAQRLPDPMWLIDVNAVSLAFALIGNSALLLNMAKRLKFSIAQPITITGFLTAGILLIADMAAVSSSSTYFITDPRAIPAANHELTSAFYYAAYAAGMYMIIGFLLCLTVYGANAGHYKREFALTAAQRTLMVQTMSFVFYLLIGALVFSHIESWRFLDGVYWAQVTMLTIGLGDYSPQTRLGRGLLFPYAIFGILTVGLVVGSTRSLVLERGKEKMAARIIEKRREAAIHNVDQRKQTIKVSWFTKADFSTDPSLTPAQRREEEFKVMRRVQEAADAERRYFALGMSSFFALVLWFAGAAVFMTCEKEQGWTYFQALYFTFVALMTIGYGDLTPSSDAGKTFFVFWSMLAVPSLTILISNMGDTILKGVSDLTNWLASFTVFPEKNGAKKKGEHVLGRLTDRAADVASRFTAPGLLGETKPEQRMNGRQHYNDVLERMASKLEAHIAEEELEEALKAEDEDDNLERDIPFYHYVLSREMRQVQKDVGAAPAKQYSWHDWEYYLKLMGNHNYDEVEDFHGQQIPNVLIPESLRVPAGLDGSLNAEPKPTHDEMRRNQPQQNDTTPSSTEATSLGSDVGMIDANKDGAVDRETEKKNKFSWHSTSKNPQDPKKPRGLRHRLTDDDTLSDWSWLGEDSPLLATKPEAEWILERLSAALVRELNRSRKGHKRRPPVGIKNILRARQIRDKGQSADGQGQNAAEER